MLENYWTQGVTEGGGGVGGGMCGVELGNSLSYAVWQYVYVEEAVY